MTIRKVSAAVMAAFFMMATLAFPVKAQMGGSRAAGRYNAAYYNYGSGVAPGAFITQGNTSTGSQTITVCFGGPGLALPDGRVIQPFSVSAPITIDRVSSATMETVTPTAVSTSYGSMAGGGQSLCANITASFTYTHGQSLSTQQVASGTFGLQEAINDASAGGGGLVVVDRSWGGGAASIASPTSSANTTPYWNVTVEDTRSGGPRNWNPTPTGLALAVPTTLTAQAACDGTHQTCSDASVVGSASWGSTAYFAVAYMDCFGNEGPASLTSTVFTTVASKAIDIASPAASTGACGWIPYASLSGGTYAQAYAIPPTSTVCTLSTLTPVPSCAMGSTYGADALFTGGAQIVTYPVNTGQHFQKLASTVQTTASYTPFTNSSVSYAYAPSSRVGTCGITSFNNTQGIAAGGISASSTAAIPMGLGSFTVPAGCFNYVGAEFRVSGKFTWTEGSTSAATYNVVVAWDAAGTNSTTIPTAVCTIANTHTPAAAAQNGYYSCTVKILTTGASGTALVNGWGDMSIATGQALLIGFANDTAVAASSAINLTAPARITVQFFDSGNTVTGAQGLENTLEVLN